ncbi:MAG: MaoC family dehydratase N-terminal domain-containing protein, partial [Deltaproteobacteria bacterium]|nr:MaoC family dehydratase N-terminal domain-containing protein [Deltaproteobacteria bacterium]
MPGNNTHQKINDFVSRTRALNGRLLNEREPWNTAVSADAIRHFCYGIGDDNPLWLDPAYAEKSRHGRLEAPPAFLTSVLYPILHGAPMDVPLSSLIVELEYRWFQPVIEGDLLLAASTQKDVFESRKRGGRRAVFIVSDTSYRNHRDELVAEATGTLMRLERVDGEMLFDRPIHRYDPDELERIG